MKPLTLSKTKKMKLAIGADHAGYAMKSHIISVLTQQGHEVIDMGTNSIESVDYPDFAHSVARSVIDGNVSLGIIMCGSGNGINMTANKHRGIRSALCWTEEIAKLARAHNDANVCALPARYLSMQEGEKIVEAFLNGSFEGGRHERRVNKIEC